MASKKNPNKYKLVVKECYAADYNSNELQTHNLKKLIFYAGTNPDKLENIGQYLNNKLSRRIRKGYDGHITTTMVIYDALIKSCSTHLPLFGKSVVLSCRQLLTSRPQCSALAVVTFRTYLEYVEDMSQLDWEFFVQHFVKMIAPSVSEELRQQGLAGLAAFVRSTENFDAFVARFVATSVETPEEMAHNCLWSVLNSSAEPSEGMRAVVSALGARVNGINLRNCLEIMLKFYAKKGGDLATRTDMFLLLVLQNRLREFLIYLAQSAAQYPNTNVLALLSKHADEHRNPGPILDAVTPLLSLTESSECVLKLLRRSSSAERIEVIALTLKHAAGPAVHSALALRVAEAIEVNSIQSSALVEEIVRAALAAAEQAPNKKDELHGVIRVLAAALKNASDRDEVVSKLNAGKEEDRTERTSVVVVFPEDAAEQQQPQPHPAKSIEVMLESLDAVWSVEEKKMGAAVKRPNAQLPKFSETFPDILKGDTYFN